MAFLWLIDGGDPKYFLTGKILQVGMVIISPKVSGSKNAGTKYLIFGYFGGGFSLT